MSWIINHLLILIPLVRVSFLQTSYCLRAYISLTHEQNVRLIEVPRLSCAVERPDAGLRRGSGTRGAAQLPLLSVSGIRAVREIHMNH